MITIIRANLKALIDDKEIRTQDFYTIRLRTIEQHWAAIQGLHYKIWEQLEEPHQNLYDVDIYYNIESEVNNALTLLYERSRATSTATLHSSQPTSLPKIVLPKFDGNYLKWVQFRDLYMELVHNQPIPQCQKMWYLKTTLTGEAERLIQHFSSSEANYTSAWEMIISRYDNKRLLATALINKIMSQTKFQQGSSADIKSLHDTTKECLLGLENIGIKTENWDPILLHVLIGSLDRNTHTLWEQSLNHPRELPSLHEFLEFLEKRFQSLEALGSSNKRGAEEPRRQNKVFTTLAATNHACIACNGNHQLYSFQQFLHLNPQQRLNLIRKERHCTNCLKPGHKYSDCTSRHCSKCPKKHNSLLHLDEGTNHKRPANSSSKAVATAEPTTVCSSAAQDNFTAKTSVLLGTAIVYVKGQDSKPISCRALLDSGSQVNLMTERLSKQLGLKAVQQTLSIEGIGQGRQTSQRRGNIEVASKNNGFSSRLEAHIWQKIVSPQVINTSSWNIPQNVVLADSQFNQPAPIDLLIGAELFYSTLSVGQISLGDCQPTLQNTVFGWIVAGKCSASNTKTMMASCGICTAEETLEKQVERFWRMEEPTTLNGGLTQSESHCETHFTHTAVRNSNGRFELRLPFKEDPCRLGESKDIAFRRFISLERRLANSPELKQLYRHFMQEYQELGHMKEVNLDKISKPYYFLPHHCVLKPDSSTTKLRVVFDASFKTSTNLSLNDILHTGPTLQGDVFTMLLRFRFPRYVFTADIEKMYRQIQISDDDQKYQLIWWRDNFNEAVKCFQLQTVTYGTSSASYMATKCLQTLAEEHKEIYPLGSSALNQDFYVDDVLTGSNKLTEA